MLEGQDWDQWGSERDLLDKRKTRACAGTQGQLLFFTGQVTTSRHGRRAKRKGTQEARVRQEVYGHQVASWLPLGWWGEGDPVTVPLYTKMYFK